MKYKLAQLLRGQVGSSPSRGTWIEIMICRRGLLGVPVVPLTGDVD